MPEDLKLPLPEPLHSIGKKWISYAQEDRDPNDIAHAIWSALHEARQSTEAQREQSADAQLIEALNQLESANNELSRLRSREMYLAMVDSGQSEALIALDDARLKARKLIAKHAQQEQQKAQPVGFHVRVDQETGEHLPCFEQPTWTPEQVKSIRKDASALRSKFRKAPDADALDAREEPPSDPGGAEA